MVYSFQIESMIHGYHQYKGIWESPSEDDALVCEREIGNTHDTHAVAIRKDTVLKERLGQWDIFQEKFLRFVLFLLDAVVQFVVS